MGQSWSAPSSDGDEATHAFYQAILRQVKSPTVCREVALGRADASYWSGVGVDSLMERCVEVIAGGIVAGQEFRLETLPAELTQLVVDVVSNMSGGQALTSRHLLESLEGARFFSLMLGGGAPRRTRMVANGPHHALGSLFPANTLERLVISDEPSAERRVNDVRRTPFDDRFLLQYAPGCLKLRFVRISHCPGVTEVSVGGLLRGLPRLEEMVVAHCRGVGDVGCSSSSSPSSPSSPSSTSSCGVGSRNLQRLVLESCLRLQGLGALLGASSDGRLASLRELNLGRCRLLKNMDAGQVARLSNLRWLDVSYTGITDSGVVCRLHECNAVAFLLNSPIQCANFLAGRAGRAAWPGVSEHCGRSGLGLERRARGAADAALETSGRVADGFGWEQHAARAGCAQPSPAREAMCRLHERH